MTQGSNESTQLPPLPQFEARGVKVEKGDSLTITDLSIAIKDLDGGEDGSTRAFRMEVPDWGTAYVAGASFSLRPALDEAGYNVDKHHVRIADGGRILMVALADTSADVLRSCYTVPERVLDLLAVEAFRLGQLDDPLREHCVWWRTPEGTVLRCVSTSRVAAELRSSAIVRAPDGSVRPQPSRPPQAWHGSHAYFRMSQLANNLHDAYRYMFLAVEAVLSTIYPWERGVGEGRWLKDALKRACEGYSIDLSQYLANPKGNPYRRFMAEQYDARRCALFHAKLDKQPIVPGDIPSRTELAEATRRLGQLYVRLASAITGAGFAGGSMTFAAFERMMAPMADSRMYISESLDFNPDNLRVAPGT